MSSKGDYLEISYDTEYGINVAIGLLEAEKPLTPDASKTLWIEARIGELEAELAKIKARRLAFFADETQIRPPSKEDIDKVADCINVLSGMIAAANASKAIIGTTTEIINTWNKTNNTV